MRFSANADHVTKNRGLNHVEGEPGVNSSKTPVTQSGSQQQADSQSSTQPAEHPVGWAWRKQSSQ